MYGLKRNKALVCLVCSVLSVSKIRKLSYRCCCTHERLRVLVLEDFDMFRI